MAVNRFPILTFNDAKWRATKFSNKPSAPHCFYMENVIKEPAKTEATHEASSSLLFQGHHFQARLGS